MALAHKFGKGIWQYDEADVLEMFKEDCYDTSSLFSRWWGED
jgi:hypothetical protein